MHVEWPKTGSLLLVGTNQKLGISNNSEDPDFLALAYARKILLQGSERSGSLLDSNSHPDFRYISPEANSQVIKIDQIRNLMHWASGKPQVALTQVAILSPAHALNLQAANALLKTLEEPSLNTLFILVTDRPSFLPATIRSRCYWVRLRTAISANISSLLKEGVQKDLEALSKNQSDPISVGMQWMKLDLKEILQSLLIILYEEMRQMTKSSGFRNSLWWKFFDAVLQAKQSLEEPNQPNAQLLIESLLIQYRAMQE